MPKSAESWYIDASALVKTVVAEAESGALISWLKGRQSLVSCDLVRVETVRAVRLSDPAALPRARSALATLTLIRLDNPIYETAADLEPALVRSLDALHMAAALSVGDDLGGIVSYDRRMIEAAGQIGLRVETPTR